MHGDDPSGTATGLPSEPGAQWPVRIEASSMKKPPAEAGGNLQGEVWTQPFWGTAAASGFLKKSVVKLTRMAAMISTMPKDIRL